MADFSKVTKNLEERGYTVRCFSTAGEAADYLDSQIDGKSVAFGGSMTVDAMNLKDRLATHNERRGNRQENYLSADVFISSVNALAETGEIINIDGNCNRVAGTLFGHSTVYFVVGANKLAPDFEAALWRAKNVAAPKNAQRLKKNTPCAVNGDKCYDCKSPDRICRAMAVLWGPPMQQAHTEVVLIDQELGL